MSGWQITREQWASWVSSDGATSHERVAEPFDELDAQLVHRLVRGSFPTGNDETVSRSGPSEIGGFDSRTTMVNRAVGEDDEETLQRAEPSGLDISLVSPMSVGGGGLKVSLEPVDAPTVITRLPEPEPPIAAAPVATPPADPSPQAVPETREDPADTAEPAETDDGLFIPTLTRTVVSPVPPPDIEEPGPAEPAAAEPPPAITGVTVIGPPPEPEPEPESSISTTSGVIMTDPDEAAQTLINGEIPVDPDVPLPSKVVVGASAGQALSEVYDEDDDDEPPVSEDEPHELDAADLVEESDVEDDSPPPAPPVAARPAQSSAPHPAPPPPPVSAARLDAAIAALPAAPPVDDNWQVDAFGEHYAALLPVHRAASANTDVEFLLQCLGLGPGATVLDVGCGDGAHAVALAQRGFRVTGLDLSAVQLMRASQAAQAAGVAINLISGDMRQAVIEGTFDAVVCLGGTLGLFSDEDDRRMLEQIRDWVRPGGRLMLQVLNRDYIVGRLPARSWWQGQGCLVLDEAQLFAPTSRVHVHRTVVFETGQQFENNVGLRVYGLTELVQACAHVGLRVLEYSGSRHTRGQFYGATSAEVWLVAERVDG